MPVDRRRVELEPFEDSTRVYAGTRVLTADADRLLLEAARRGDLEGVVTALRLGASVGARDELGRTALHYAAEGGYLEIVERLAGGGAPRVARA